MGIVSLMKACPRFGYSQIIAYFWQTKQLTIAKQLNLTHESCRGIQSFVNLEISNFWAQSIKAEGV